VPPPYLRSEARFRASCGYSLQFHISSKPFRTPQETPRERHRLAMFRSTGWHQGPSKSSGEGYGQCSCKVIFLVRGRILCQGQQSLKVIIRRILPVFACALLAALWCCSAIGSSPSALRRRRRTRTGGWCSDLGHGRCGRAAEGQRLVDVQLHRLRSARVRLPAAQAGVFRSRRGCRLRGVSASSAALCQARHLLGVQAALLSRSKLGAASTP